MNKVLSIAAILIMALCSLSCSSSDEEEQATNNFTYDEILGTWISTSFLCSGGYFIPVHNDCKDTFVFNENQTYKFNDEHGTFVYNENTKVLWCKDSRGWDMEIFISFDDTEHAVFYIKGKNEIASSTLKMERIKK